MSKNKYYAFISYSHRDKSWADWIHKNIETYRIPSELVNKEKGIGKNLYPVFRDREELPGSADLGKNISEGLATSGSLLVLCSPRSAQSMWVNEEVKNFQVLSPGKKIIALLIEGNNKDKEDENYCLTPEMTGLIESNNAIVIDARTSGKNNEIKLELISIIAGIDRSRLAALDRKRKRKQKIISFVSLAGLVVGSLVIYEKIQLSQNRGKQAEIEKLIINAKQEIDNIESSRLMDYIIRAMEIEAGGDFEYDNKKLKDLLNRVAKKPILLVRRGKSSHKVKYILPTSDTDKWILVGESDEITLYDIKQGRKIWGIKENGIVRAEINNLQQLIIRTEEGLNNYNLATGSKNCSISLATEPEIMRAGSLGWIQKNWIVESTKMDLNLSSRFIGSVDFINTADCKKLITKNVAARNISLVDVLQSDSWITVSDTMFDGKDFNIYTKWRNGGGYEQQGMLKLEGVTKSYIKGMHNQFEYNGPIIKTDKNENISYIVLKNRDKANLALVKVEWKEQKVDKIDEFTGVPEGIYVLDGNTRRIGVKIKRDNSEYYRITGLDDSDLKIKDFRMRSNSTVPIVSRNNKYALSNNTQKITIQAVDNRTYFDISARQMAEYHREDIKYGWIDNNTAIYIDRNGEIYTIHLNNIYPLIDLKNKDCCYKTIDQDRKILMAMDGSIYTLNPKNYKLQGIYKPDKKYTDYQFLESNRILIAGYDRDPQQANQVEIKIMELSRKDRLWNKKINYEYLDIDENYISYRSSSSGIINILDAGLKEYSYKNGSDNQKMAYDKKANRIVIVYAINNPLKKNILHIKLDNIENNKIDHSKIDMENEILSENFEIDPENRKIYAISSDRLKNSSSLVIIDYEDHKTRKIKLNGQSSLDYTRARIYRLANYIVFEENGISGKSYELYNLKKSSWVKQLSNKQLIIDSDLLGQDRIVSLDRARSSIEIINTNENQTRHIDCPVNFDVTASYSREYDKIIIISKSACIIDKNTGEVEQIVEFNGKDDSVGYALGAVIDDQPGKILITNRQGIMAVIDINNNWRENLVRARSIYGAYKMAGQKSE